MIFPVDLKVFGQMLDPAGKKCDLHICAAGIFLMQLELLEIRRLVALCHNEGANLDEDRVLATHALKRPRGGICVRSSQPSSADTDDSSAISRSSRTSDW